MAPGKKTEFLYLNEEDMIKAGVLDSAHCVDVEAEVFELLGKGDYVMGGPNHNEHGQKLFFPKESPFPNMPLDGPDRRFMSMIAYLGGRFNVAGEKWYGSNVANPARGLPRSVLMVMLNNADTGEPIALMSANLLSAVRTGCVPGVGVRYLANKDAKVLSVIAAGPVSRACFQGIQPEAKNLEEIVVYDLFPEKSQAYVDWVKETYGIKGRVVESLEECVRAGDIISVAASALKPLQMKNEWFKPGSLTIFTGGGDIDEEYWKSVHLVWDNAKTHLAYMEDAHETDDPAGAYKILIAGQVFQMIDEGKMPPLTEHTSLGDIVVGKKPGRQSHDERICLATTGMPVMDVGWGYECYLKAKELGLGQTLKLWDESYWR